MSSFINKSSKKLAPKANIRRRHRDASPVIPSLASPPSDEAVQAINPIQDVIQTPGKTVSHVLPAILQASPPLTQESRQQIPKLAQKAVSSPFEIEELQAIAPEDTEFPGALVDRPTKRRRVKGPTIQSALNEPGLIEESTSTADTAVHDKFTPHRRKAHPNSASANNAVEVLGAEKEIEVESDNQGAGDHGGDNDIEQDQTPAEYLPEPNRPLRSDAADTEIIRPVLAISKKVYNVPETPSLAQIAAARRQAAALKIETLVANEIESGDNSVSRSQSSSKKSKNCQLEPSKGATSRPDESLNADLAQSKPKSNRGRNPKNTLETVSSAPATRSNATAVEKQASETNHESTAVSGETAAVVPELVPVVSQPTPEASPPTPTVAATGKKTRKPRKKVATLSAEIAVEDELFEALTANALAYEQELPSAEATKPPVGDEQDVTESTVVKMKRGPYKRRKRQSDPAAIVTNQEHTQVAGNKTGQAVQFIVTNGIEPAKKKRKYTKKAIKWFDTASEEVVPEGGSDRAGQAESHDDPETAHLTGADASTTLATDHAGDHAGDQVPKKRRGRPPKAKLSVPIAASEEDIIAETIEVDGPEPEVVGDEDEVSKESKKKKKRAATPEDAENIEIDTSLMSMFELCKDRKQGKKSTLEQDMRKIDWSEVAAKRKRAREAAKAALEKARDDVFRNDVEEGDEEADEAPRRKGPRLRLNAAGEIVLDAESLTINRHALPEEITNAVEESDLTKRITSASWLYANKRDPLDRHYIKSDRWSIDETDIFYGCLKMFGTDFDMISKMFRGRTRKMIKLKFSREERANEPRIRAVLLGQSDPMSLETYADMTGRRPEDYKDPEELDRELKEDEERQRVDIEHEREGVLEAAKKKQEAAQLKAEAQARRKAGEKVPRKKRTKKAPGEKVDRSKVRAERRKKAAAERAVGEEGVDSINARAPGSAEQDTTTGSVIVGDKEATVGPEVAANEPQAGIHVGDAEEDDESDDALSDPGDDSEEELEPNTVLSDSDAHDDVEDMDDPDRPLPTVE